MNRRDRLVLWLAARIPGWVLAEPERVFLAVAVLLIGIDAFLPPNPGRVLSDDTPILTAEFGAFFTTGGLFTLLGLWRHRVWQERLGQALTALGCGVFVVGVVVSVGVSAAAPTIIYISIAVTYALRLLSTAVARIRLHAAAARDRGPQ